MHAQIENNGQSMAKRKMWDERSITHALLTLKTHDLKGAAKRLQVSPDSLRLVLAREGISVRAYRKAASRNKQLVHAKSRTSAFVAPLSGNSERPFLAMNAIERKPANGCSWPTGDLEGDHFEFCGAPRLPRKPYCARCYKRAYTAAPPLDKKLYKLI